MRKTILACAVISAMAGVIALMGGVASADGSDVKQRAQDLVKQLSDDDASVREKATEELSKLGPEAVPVLEEAAKSSDAEVQWRAQKALAKIRGNQEEPSDAEADRTPPAPRPQRQVRIPGAHIEVHLFGPGNYSMTQDGSGHIRLSVAEKDANGQDVQKTYEADSTEDFKRKYPDVAEKYHIGEGSIVIGPQQLPPPDLGNMEQQMQDLEKQMQEALKDFDKNFGKGFRWQWRLPFGHRKPPAIEPPNSDDSEDEADTPSQPQPREGRGNVGSDIGADVSYIDDTLRDQLDLPGEGGVVVDSVGRDTPAEKSGLQKHDVVLSVNGEPVKTKWDFRRLILEGARSGKVEMEVVRKGEKKTLTVDPSLLGK